MLGGAEQELVHHVEDHSDTDDYMTAQPGSLCSYHEVVNNLLKKYAGNSKISTTWDAITSLWQRQKQASISFKVVIFTKTSLCGKVYPQDTCNHIFLDGMHPSVQ